MTTLINPSSIPATLAVVNTIGTPIVAGSATVPVGSSTVQLAGLATGIKVQTWNALVTLTSRGYLTSTATTQASSVVCPHALTGGQSPTGGQSSRGGHTLRGGQDDHGY